MTKKFALQLGDRPLDGYTITGAVDRGAFGDVYQAVSDGGKEVALKLVRRGLELELRGVRECLNLKHPNLITIYDVRRDKDGDYWIVMEYISGRRLDQVLADHPEGLPAHEVHRWLKGIAEGLSFLHRHGIIHRDIKPSNVFIEDGQIKIADVGLAKHVAPSRRYANTRDVGTLHYMAPEVGRGRYGPETDIYSLGVLLYEMLTGRVPFDGETSAEILLKHLTEPPDLSPLPPPLRPLLADLLNKDPDERLRRAGDLRAVVRRFEQAVGTKLRQGETEPKGGEPFLRHASDGEDFGASSDRLAASEQAERAEVGSFTFWARRAWSTVCAEYRSLPRWIRVALWGALIVGGLAWLPLLAPAVAVCFILYLLFRLAYSLARMFGKERSVVQWMAQDRGRKEGSGLSGRAPIKPQAAVGAGGAPSSGPAAQPSRHARPTAVTGPHSSNRTKPDRQTAAKPPAPPSQWHPLREPPGPETVRSIPFWQRMGELSAGAALAVPLVALFTVLIQFLFGFPGDRTAAVFFGSVSVVGVWAVLAVSKWLEGRESAPRRLAQFLAGLAVGLAAYALQRGLFVDVTVESNGAEGVLSAFLAAPIIDTVSRQPTAAGYAVFFGALFLLQAWWKQADAFRLQRVRALPAIASAALAYVLAEWGVGFATVWGVWWATVISSVVQLAAPWIPHSARHQVTQTNVPIDRG